MNPASGWPLPLIRWTAPPELRGRPGFRVSRESVTDGEAGGTTPIVGAFEPAGFRPREDGFVGAPRAHILEMVAHAFQRFCAAGVSRPGSTMVMSGSHCWCKRGASTACCMFMPKSITLTMLSRWWK